ncbi:MAG: hypothetical protein R3266_15740, partial [Gemmatimonadota bacterium]|nr:hypothetical protein [Gemmatimonadota bacterium]
LGALAGAVVVAVDPRLDGAAAALARHMMNAEWTTQFWEYLLWAMSPLPLVFAVLGLRALADDRHVLFWTAVLGSLGPMLFYFRATTTPRYFLLAVVPIAIASAVGMTDVIRALRGRLRPAVAWTGVLALGTAHLFIGLGRFPATPLQAIVTEARIPTHDGLMPTGALLYDTYLRGGLFRQSLGHPGFGRASRPNPEGVTFRAALEELDGRDGDQTVILLFDAGWDHAFHFHAQEAGATYVAREPGDSSAPFASETWLEVGDVSLMPVRFGGPDYAALDRLDVSPGDEVWVTGRNEREADAFRDKVPAGLRLRRVESFHPRIRVFRVEADDA